MIITKKILINKPTGKYFKYYKDLGYDVSCSKIEINIEHLSLGSNYEILAKCFYCNLNKKISYSSYNKSTKRGELNYACKDCGVIKQKELCIEKWGVENYFQLNDVKEKIKKTNIDKYGVDSYTKTDEYKERVRQTNLDKYGVENYSQTNEYNDKVKETSLLKWGVDHYSKTDDYKEKSKKTSIGKYGVDSYAKTDEYKEKSKKTSIEKYGVDHYSKTDEYKDKIKETSLLKWGVDHYSKTDRYKDKIKETSLLKYGVDHYSKTDEYKEKTKKTSIEKYGVENYSQTKEYSDKVKETSLLKWGVENYTQTDEYKKRSKKTSIEKYGVDSYTKTDEYKEKSKKTSIEKYGVDSISKSDEYRKKFFITKHKNYIKYISNGDSVFNCDKGINHTFIIGSDNFYHRLCLNIPLCTICNPISALSSIKENELFEYIKSVYNGIVLKNYRDGLEIDIYLPDLNIGFEFNGLYWHSEKFKDENYHLNKFNYFNERGIRIINIWEDDWVLKSDILKSNINKIVKSSKYIHMSKCIIKEVDNNVSNIFLDKNHKKGSIELIDKSIGIYFKDELLSVMTFNYQRLTFSDNSVYGWNLSSFCDRIGLCVIGGNFEMLNFFIEKYNVGIITSFIDRDMEFINFYNDYGFFKISETKPDYKYIIKEIRVDKYNLVDINYNEENSLLRIFDTGKIKYQLNIK